MKHQIETKIQEKLKKIPYFQVSDSTNDDVKNRCIYPIFLLIYYIILVFLMITLIQNVYLSMFSRLNFVYQKTDSTPRTINRKIDMNYNYYFSLSFSKVSPSPRVQALTATVDKKLNL